MLCYNSSKRQINLPFTITLREDAQKIRRYTIMHHTYTPTGVCSAQIDFDLEDGILHNIRFTRGCNGNTQGLASLCAGMKVGEVIARLEGINCKGRGTSCPDQLARALKQL